MTTDSIELFNSSLSGLAWKFQVNPSSCGNHEHYENYIRLMALTDQQSGIQYVTLCADQQAVPFYEKLKFGRLDEQGEIPREQWNENCVPMFLRLLI